MTRADAIAHLTAKRDAAIRRRDDRGAPWNHTHIDHMTPEIQRTYREQHAALVADVEAYALAIEALSK